MLLYIILIHHQTTTLRRLRQDQHTLYLILIHHQTTTGRICRSQRQRCISSLFITKPQHMWIDTRGLLVVSHPYSSPNHNQLEKAIAKFPLYLILIHHQTTTLLRLRQNQLALYIIFIHHQTTTGTKCGRSRNSCISSSFITKPQPICSNSLV